MDREVDSRHERHRSKITHTAATVGRVQGNQGPLEEQLTRGRKAPMCQVPSVGCAGLGGGGGAQECAIPRAEGRAHRDPQMEPPLVVTVRAAPGQLLAGPEDRLFKLRSTPAASTLQSAQADKSFWLGASVPPRQVFPASRLSALLPTASFPWHRHTMRTRLDATR